jgi:DNA-binding beta-propeller fold protein YncE/mono/diheme cytochrome c family protein
MASCALVASAACSRTTKTVVTAASPAATIGKGCARLRTGGAARLGSRRASSAIALVKGEMGDKRVLAYIADADEPTLHTVDLAGPSEVATTPLIGRPEHVLVLGDGRVAVTLRASNAIQVLEPAVEEDAALETRCVVGTPTEPIALALTPDDGTLLLTTGWGHRLTAYDAETLAPKFEALLPRDPRSAVVSEDGTRAFVAHVVGARMSVVDLTTPAHEVRSIDLAARLSGEESPDNSLLKGCQGFALTKLDDRTDGKLAKMVDRVFAPMVAVNSGEGLSESSGYGPDGPSEISEVAVVDAAAERALTRVVRGPSGLATETQCLLPRAAAYDDGALYVTCLGIDALLKLDARGIDPARSELKRWHVAAGPTGVAIDPGAGRAVVWSQFDRELSVVDTAGTAEPVRLALARKASGVTSNVALGRRLFHQVGDARISADGRACASCHPDGREDALTWSTPDGSRQTPMLAGRLAETAPYGWLGSSDGVKGHLKKTFERLGGEGLPSIELSALIDYVSTMTPSIGATAFAPAEKETLVVRGRALFESAETGCGTCHDVGRGFIDGVRHSVSVHRPDKEGETFDTPSLKFVSGTAPYFHDGRYRTLDDVLTAPDHAMGTSTKLGRQDRAALVAYLETL